MAKELIVEADKDQEEYLDLIFNQAIKDVERELVLGTYQEDITKSLKKKYGLNYSIQRRGDGVIRVHLYSPVIGKGKKFKL